MEKDKGIFPFGKHPVGELPDGKKERKRKESRLRGVNARKMHRALGMLLAAALLFNALPASGFAVSASKGETGLCEQHRSHTAECGYAEAQPCTHECSEESGCITEVLDCHHEHKVNGGEADREDGLGRDESCGYQEAQECGYVCEICNGTEPEDTEDNTENDTEDAGETKETENERPDDADTNLCVHHREHRWDCGYSEEDNTPCGYDCRICPIEDLIAVLPDTVTEDNRADTEVQLQEILALFSELTEDEQEQADISRCLELQGQLDEASVPMPLADTFTMNGDITINSGNVGQYDGKTLTGTSNSGYTLAIDGTTVDLTISGLNFTGGGAGTIVLKNGAVLNLTLQGSNRLEGGGSTAGITVPAGCSLTIGGTDADSLTVLGGSGGAGIGANYYAGSSASGTPNTVGSITINGGNITAIGSAGGAGIGGTLLCNTGRVIINGGTVTATGNKSTTAGDPAGIGGGNGGYLESITINGGTVTATSSSAAAGIGAGYFDKNNSGEYPASCGDIRINGGTVQNTVIGYGSESWQKDGSITIGEDADLPGCTVRPLPADYASYTFRGTVYDTSITGNASAVFSIGGRRCEVMINVNNAEPYRGDFTVTIIMTKRDAADASLTWGGKTLTAANVSLSDTTSITFGTQDYSYCSLHITICDEAITGSMAARVTIHGQVVEKQLEKTAEYCGEITINKIVLPNVAVNDMPPVTITAGGKTWSGEASSGKEKTLTIGQPILPADLTLDLACGDIAFENDKITYYENAGANPKVIFLDSSQIYEVIQSSSTTAATTNRLTINPSKPVHVRIKDLNIHNQGGDYSPVEIGGDVTLELSGSSTVASTTKNDDDKGKAAIHVPEGAELTLTGTGSLEAVVNSDAHYGCAGIGGNYRLISTTPNVFENGGAITIQSGTITAQSGNRAAGIGGGYKGAGTVTINGGMVTATGGPDGAGIGGGSEKTGTVTINGGVVMATGGASNSYSGAGIGGSYNGTATVTITGGTITATAGYNSHGIGPGKGGNSASTKITITGGSVQTIPGTNSPSPLILSPKNSSNQDLSLVTLTLDGTGDQVLVNNVEVEGGYGIQDVYTRDGGKLYIYLPAGTLPEKIMVNGVDYAPESAGSTKYVVAFDVELNGYSLTKVYDGTPMAEPATDQVTSNGKDLAFAWYQDDAKMASAPVNVGNYTLRVSSNDKGSKDFMVEITKRPLTITVGNQTIEYNGTMKQTEYTHGELAEGDNLTVTLAALPTVLGTHEGAITATVQITRNGADAAGNYNITCTPGTLTINKAKPTVSSRPTASEITYGQSVGEMTITGGTAQAGNAFLAGTWTASDTDKKPSAGTAEVTIIFTPDDENYDSVSVQVSLTVSQRSLNADGVTVSEVAGTYTYTGFEIKPAVTVHTGTRTPGISISDSKAALTADDFTVSYRNNKDAGTASVTITGKGNYTGSVTRNFTIGKAPGREVLDLSESYTDNGQTYTYTVTPTEGAVYRMGNDGKWQEGNVFDDIKPGTSVTFYAKMPETGNYEEGATKSITVVFPKLTPAAPALSYTRGTDKDGKIALIIAEVTGAQYSFDGGANWQDAWEQGGFTTSQTVTLAIRLKETDTHNPSPSRTVTVDLAKKDRGAPPVFSLKVEANGETDYTVNIPPTEGCEYSFDGETWSDNNRKANVNVGETVTGYKRYKQTDDYNASSAVSAKETMPKFTVKKPVISPAGGSYSGSVSVTITCGSQDAEIYYTTDGSAPGRGYTRYTGAFTVSAPATVRAVAIKDGLNDSAIATASYTKKSGGGSGGGNGGGSGDHSGGNENNSGSGGKDEGQGSGGNDNTNPGNGTTAGPGTAPSSGAGTSAEGTGQPFIKGEDGKIGWDVIRAEEEKAEEGSVINVDMNGTAVVPGDIFDSIKGKDIIINFDMGNGILWSIDGKSITTDKAGDIDFSVKTETNAIPVDIVNNVTGERYSIQISLAYEGEFGFTALLSINLGKENKGYTASLYYYNESIGELEFICSDEVAEDGTVSLAFTHASDYVIAIDGDEEEESGSVTEPAQLEDQDADSTGQAWRPWWLIVAGALVIIMGIGAFFVVRKKEDDE